MKIQRDSKQREYNKELAFDVEAFLQANEGNFVSEFEETLEGTGRAADDCDGYHDFVYSEENVENVKETMSELYLIYLCDGVAPTPQEMQLDDIENTAREARGY